MYVKSYNVVKFIIGSFRKFISFIIGYKWKEERW